MRLFVGQVNPIIGDIEHNTHQIIQAIKQAKKDKCDVAIFPEMAICGYNPDDLLLEKGFVDAIESGLAAVAKASKGINVIVGTVRDSSTTPGKPFRNSACVIIDGKIVGFQEKCLLPTYDVFDEWRHFEPAKSERIWEIGHKKIGITICEDIWPAFDPFCESRYADDPLECFQGKGLDLLVNISASPYSLGKIKRRKEVALQVAKLLHCPVVIVNQVGGQDGLLFDGSSVCVVPTGELQYLAKSFAPDSGVIDLTITQRLSEPHFEPGEELCKALVMGVKDYFHKQGFHKALLGLSGGVDSAVVACVAVQALGKENVLAVSLPSRFTSEESRQDARQIAQNLGIELKEISIEAPFESVLKSLEPHFEGKVGDVTEENIQSRVRAILLMALSNKLGYIVLNTGNKSELAMGYTTLYGDAIGSIAVLGDLLKRQVYEVARYLNRQKQMIPERAINRAPSAELRPNQKDSDTLPEYPLLDVIVDEHVVHHLSGEEIASKHGFDKALCDDVVRKIHQNEYKRRQVPFALRVSEKCFSVGRKVPIVHRYNNF